MKLMIVDDERLAIRYFEMETADIEDVEIVGAFCNPEEALEYAGHHELEAVLLDIEMPGISGLVLAEKLRKIYPELVIVFITGYEKYAIDTFKIKADYYLLKPYSREDLKDVLERIRLLVRRQKKRIRIRTFGRFDLFVEDRAVWFANTKSKELLALCVDHRGGMVSMEEAIDKLWENREYDNRVKNLYRKAVMNLRQELQEESVDKLFFNTRGACNIDSSKVECDYYDFLEGNRSAVRQWEISRCYLQEYTWAEETSYNIENIYQKRYGK